MMTLTIDHAKKWVTDNYDELEQKRINCADPDVQMFNSIAPKLSKTLWDSGCWLAHILRNAGATDQEVQSIQMAHGQRSFGADPWQTAVDYANEYCETGDTVEKGGLELGLKRNAEFFGDG